MKTKLFLFFAMLMAVAVANAADNKAVEVFTLDHQMSTHCEKKIKENLRFEKGVSNIEVSLEENTITITYNPSKTDTEKLLRAFKKIGFNAEVVNAEAPIAVSPEICPETQASPCCTETPAAPCCSSTPASPCCQETPASPCCQ